MKRLLLFSLLIPSILFAVDQKNNFNENANGFRIFGVPYPPPSPNDVATKQYVDAQVAAGGVVTSVFGRIGAVVATTGDYSAAQVTHAVDTTASYSNPAWITSLIWSKISSTPTTLSGYGITDPVVLTSGSYSNPSWITALIWSKISSTPTTLAGYGITDAVPNTRSISTTSPLTGGGALSGNLTLSIPAATNLVNGYLTSTDWTTFNSKQSALTLGNLSDAGTDGITVTGGTSAVIGSGTSLSQHVSDTTHNGYLSSTDWNTFNGKQSTLTLGNLTDAGTDGITVTGGTGSVVGSGASLAQHVADSTHNGYLSSTDWGTFNGKQSALTLGTGVATALAVNVGTAGAFVVNGGALGTPSSGTLTNATGLPESAIVWTDPNANTIRIWDDTDNAMVNATIGTNLTYTHSTHTLSATGGGGGTIAVTTNVLKGDNAGNATDTGLAAPTGSFVGTSDNQALTNKDLTGAGNTFPTFNQNTTGSSAKWTTARNLAGNSVDGSANVAFSNKFIVQGTTDTGLSGAQFLGALATGLLKNTTTTGVLSAAAASDVVSLFSTCSGTQYLGADGACHTAGGSGTVTSFSAGDLSPLFTTSVANPSTTPALSFSLSNAAAHSYFGNNTGSSAAPSFHVIDYSELANTPTPAPTATPAGSPTQVQFNDGGSFGGNANFTWDNTDKVVTLKSGGSVNGLQLIDEDGNPRVAIGVFGGVLPLSLFSILGSALNSMELVATDDVHISLSDGTTGSWLSNGYLIFNGSLTPGAIDPSKLFIYQSTSSNIAAKNNAGVINHGVQTKAADTNKFLTAIADDGSVSNAQPGVSDISGFGTGVATALAVNVGSAGSVVVNGGALGTPSSGSAANLTSFPTLNQNTTGSAAKLTTARNLWGQSFDGTADVTGSLTGVGNITGGASSMNITAGTGNNRSMILKTTDGSGVAGAFLSGNPDLSTTFGAGFTAAGNSTIGTSNAFTTGTIKLGTDGIILKESVLGRLQVDSGSGAHSVAISTDDLAFLAASTTNTIGVGNIELGHATDTTISRSSGGHISVEGVVVPLSAADIVGKFSTCSGTQYLGADGACHTAGGGGTIATTTAVLKGDNAGNAIAATAKTDYWDTTDFVASGASHAHGLVPDPGVTGGSTKFLREDATWVVPTTGSVASTTSALAGDGAGNAIASTSSNTADFGTTTISTGLTLSSAPLTLSGNISSAAWTTNGLRLKGTSVTLTDTTSSGTVAAAYTDVLGGNTIAATNVTTFTDYYTMYVKAPVQGSNVTLTNKWGVGGESMKIGTTNPVTISTAGAVTMPATVSGVQQGVLSVDSAGKIVVGKVARASGNSTSGTPGTDIAHITAGAGNQFININGVGTQNTAANTNYTVTITYSDSTTTTLSTGVNAAGTIFVNDAAMLNRETAAAPTAHSAKRITGVGAATTGTGTGGRNFMVSALEVPQ